jgi:flavodoxin
MKVLTAYYSETGNTAQVARAIHHEARAQGHEAHLQTVHEVGAEDMLGYDLVFLGSACHDSRLARPVEALLDRLPLSPPFRLAGFATHSCRLPDGTDEGEMLYEQWAAGCPRAFEEVSRQKAIELLGYFGCQGAASPGIEAFIHQTIITGDEAWQAYVEEMRQHPNEDDLLRARAFARKVLAQF